MSFRFKVQSRSWMFFFKIFKIQLFCCFITQHVKKQQHWSSYEDIPPFVLKTKWPLSDIWLLSYKQNSFGCFFEKIEILIFFKNTQNCFTFNSATKYRSEAVLYSKQMSGYPLSPPIKTIPVDFYMLSNKATKRL